MKFAFGALVLLVGCAGNTAPGVIYTDSGLDTASDTTAPVVTCTPITDAQPLHDDVIIDCNATDDSGIVYLVQVNFKEETANTYDDALLKQVDNAGNYEGKIPGNKVESAGIDWYVDAQDGSDNIGYAPEEGESKPYHFRVYEL